MSRQLANRLTRLERRTARARCFPLLVQYVGDPTPEEEPPLIVWVHHPWCDDPGHVGACARLSPEAGGTNRATTDSVG